MDTIAAITTPMVQSAVGIVRISGPDAVRVAGAVFSCTGKKTLAQTASHKLVYGTVHEPDGRALDHCLCAVMRAPHSYTGEDVAELFCHGSPVVLARVLALLLCSGARMALPGEYTRRAFLNGRLDLAQAEAVIDLISAQTEEAARSAAAQLDGTISVQISDSYRALAGAAAHFQAGVDYPEEDIDAFELSALRQTLHTHAQKLHALAATFERGSVLRDGVPCAIIGKPNVGKSSLLNALLGFERAIVTQHPGTTRDTLEECVKLGGVLLRLTDTAGIRETGDDIEAMGVSRAQSAARGARLVLLVLDSSRPLDEDDLAVVSLAEGRQSVVLINKSDLPAQLDAAEISRRFPDAIRLSAKTGQGLDALEACIGALYHAQPMQADGSLLTNARHASLVERAAGALDSAAAALDCGMTADVVLTDVEDALEALGEITGVQVPQDILERIFSRFCVGK